MRDYFNDPGTPEEEAMRFRVLPLVYRMDRLREKWIFNTNYYDRPEGQDLLGKILHLNRLVLKPALFWGLTDALMFTNQPTATLRVARTLHFLWPAAGCATAFVTGAYAANRIRGKDDFANWIVGSLAAGSVVGKWARSGLWGWNAVIVFTIAAGCQRIAHYEGWKFFHELEPGNDSIRDAESHRWHTYSQGEGIYKDVPKGYTIKH